jgi:hypothetical protein
MRRVRSLSVFLFLTALLPAAPLRAAGSLPTDFRPDPRSVQRYGPAYRYPQAGWIVLHVEGEPYERGYQHGRLLAPEIAAYVRCFAALQSPKAPADGWKLTRTLVDSLFVRRYDKEYLEEMKGIAAGANDAGARFDGRPLDLVDVVALNAWAEVDTLGTALRATPTGLEGLRFPEPQLHAAPPPKPMHCSAFAATGPATADGKVVFGHITMFGLYPSSFFNVWLDVKPARGQGHRVLMQSYPGGIQSGLDYYFNDAGLLVCETTLAQTRFDGTGLALASRIRKALQYADTIDDAAEVLARENNGLYTNEWLLADIKTNEIAMFELGTHRTRLWRSSKNEWFGGTEGFYWGCNNTKDLEVRLETIPGTGDRPGNMVFHPSDRDMTWQRLYARWRGRIDADFGKEAFTTPPLAAYHSVDAKFTTTDMARDLKTWALFGPPLGHSWQPTRDEQEKYPDIRPLASNPWTVLHAAAPSAGEVAGAAAVDLPGTDLRSRRSSSSDGDPEERAEEERHLLTGPAWRGTLLPKTDADVWLAAAFANYEKFVNAEKVLRQRSSDHRLSAADRDRLAVQLFGARAGYLAAARAGEDVPLVKTRADVAHDEWYRVAAGKGVLVLNELRQLLGDEAFTGLMDSFGRAHAGKAVTTAEFEAHLEKTAPAGFFDYWLKQAGLPVLRLGKVTVTAQVAPAGKTFRVEGEVRRSAAATVAGKGDTPAPALPPASVDVTVETARGEVTKAVRLEGASATFVVEADAAPRRVVVDKYGLAARANGGAYTVQAFDAEREQTLIVYGTADEEAANREAAEALQRAVIQRWSNTTIPIKSDKEVTDEEVKTHHLLLVGRPDCNALTERFRAALPVRFGSRSFVVRQDAYVHADSAVVAAAANPANPRYSVTVVAGLSAASTLRAAPAFVRDKQAAPEVLVLPHEGRARRVVVPPEELVHEFSEK